jgi:hypothetical protein
LGGLRAYAPEANKESGAILHQQNPATMHHYVAVNPPPNKNQNPTFIIYIYIFILCVCVMSHFQCGKISVKFYIA